MEKNVNLIQKMTKIQLQNQLRLRNVGFAKMWQKPRLLETLYKIDGSSPPKIDKIEDIATLYYLKSSQVKEQLKIRNLQPIRGMRKKETVETIIKHDGHQVPARRPPNPNKPRSKKASFRRRGQVRQKIFKSKKRPAYSTYIYKVLKQVHPDTGISQKSMQIMNDYIYDILIRVGKEAQVLCELFNKKTLTSREIQTAIRLCLPGELCKHAVSEGTKAVTKFNSSGGGGNRSFRAGLQFPVGRIHSFLKNGNFASRIGKGAPVYLAAVVEYLVAEVLELAGNASRDNKKSRIIPRHISLAVRNDEELNKLLAHVTIPGAGMLPNIHAALIPRKHIGKFGTGSDNGNPSQEF